MLTALRRRLWLLMACLTGAVLAAALFAACRMAQGQQRQAGSAAFLQLCGQLAQQIESGAALHSGQLARFEAQHALVIRITDNGFPVSILGGWLEPRKKAALLAQAVGQAPVPLPLFGAAQPWQFEWNGQNYRALAARIPMARGACELVLLQDLAAEQKALRWTALTFFALFLGGLFTLCVVSRMLAGLAVRPTAKSIQRQADFVAAAGHELRSPVAAVRANLEVMAGASPPEAARCRAARFAVASLFRLPVADGSVDLCFNVFSPLCPEEFLRILAPGGHFLAAYPAARHLWGLKQVLYDEPYENPEKSFELPGFTIVDRRRLTYSFALEENALIRALFTMTPYYYKTPEAGAGRLAACPRLESEADFWVVTYRRGAA